MKIIAIIIFIFSLSSVSAQIADIRYKKEADSIQQLLSKHVVGDQQKVIWLNEFARLSFHGLEFKKGLIACKKAREISRKSGFKYGEVLYYGTMADLFRNSIFSFYYQKRADWVSNELEETNNVKIFNVRNFQWRTGLDEQKILNQLIDAYLYFESEKDKEMMANIDVLKSWSYFTLGKFDESAKKVDTALVLFKELKQTFPIFQLSSLRMFRFMYEGKQKEAQKIELQLIKMISIIKDKKMVALLSLPMADFYKHSGRPSMAIEYFLKSAAALEEDIEISDKDLILEVYNSIAYTYSDMNNQTKTLEYFIKAKDLLAKLKDSVQMHDVYGKMVFTLIALKRYGEARKYMALAMQDPRKELAPWRLAKNYDANGQIEVSKGNYKAAIPFFNNALVLFFKHSKGDLPYIYCNLADCYKKVNMLPEAINFAQLAYEASKTYDSRGIEQNSSLLLSQIYEQQGHKVKAFKYLKIYQQLKDVSDDMDDRNNLANVEIQSILEKSNKEIEKLEKRRIEKESENKNQRLWIVSMSGALLSAIVLLLLLYRNNKQKQKVNALLLQQKKEINSQRKRAEKALKELRSTQNQLIQSEKMASLGELTAGIAHEIQNPLNFVNNFSEVSNELIREIQEERSKSKEQRDEELVDEILTDISGNLEKISHHGKRADSIVKGMLQHSRLSSGQKEPTDINKLADEYLRLAYYGLRAKDKSFNADLLTDFDVTLPKINVLPQEIGRVLLNLFTNAFYAAQQRQKKEDAGYKAIVSVKTAVVDKVVRITVKDNGTGIPEIIKDKIMQPFFTTKPSGEGTGLGLSLSYDIVVKEHGGTIEIDSRENDYTIFTILLPIE